MECCTMSTAFFSIKGPITVLPIERISNPHRLVCSQEFLAHFGGERVVHDDPTRGSAALARRADCAEKDRLRCHIEPDSESFARVFRRGCATGLLAVNPASRVPVLKS